MIDGLVRLIGIPIKMDEAIEKRVRIYFARTLVDIKAKFGFPNYLDAVEENGEIFKQEVLHENPIAKCGNYCYFGHLSRQCLITKVWKPKQQQGGLGGEC